MFQFRELAWFAEKLDFGFGNNPEHDEGEYEEDHLQDCLEISAVGCFFLFGLLGIKEGQYGNLSGQKYGRLKRGAREA